MRKTMGALGILAALAIMVLSAAANSRYSMSLAREGVDQIIMAGVALFADAAKALSWMFFAGAVARRHVLAAATSLVIFAGCLTMAVSGSLGFIAMQRAQSTAVVDDQGKRAKDLDAEIKRKEGQLSNLGAVEPVGVMQKKVEAQQQDRRYVASARCSEATIEASRQFCAGFARLEGELRKSEEASRLEKDIQALKAQRKGLGAVAVAEKGDYQAAFIAQLTSLSLPDVQTRLALLIVFVLEAGSCFMLWLSLDYASSSPLPKKRKEKEEASTAAVVVTPAAASPLVQKEAPKQIERGPVVESTVTVLPPVAQPADFAEFVNKCLEHDDEAETEIRMIGAAFERWCEQKGRRPFTADTFRRSIEKFCDVSGNELAQRGGKVVLVGVALKKSSRSSRTA